MPGKRPVARFAMDTTLKAQALAFSRDGTYMVILGGLPDFKISIYDLEARKLLALPDTKLTCKEDIKQVSFNPKTKNEFCILSEQCIFFYQVLPAFQVFEEMNDNMD
jgi:hypothetical protein